MTRCHNFPKHFQNRWFWYTDDTDNETVQRKYFLHQHKHRLMQSQNTLNGWCIDNEWSLRVTFVNLVLSIYVSTDKYYDTLNGVPSSLTAPFNLLYMQKAETIKLVWKLWLYLPVYNEQKYLDELELNP